MAYRLEWHGAKVLADAVAAIDEALMETGAEQEWNAKDELYPGHGVDTYAMKKSVHYAPGGYPWEADAVKAGPGAPERGGKKRKPARLGDLHVIELGSGQAYAIYYHEKQDAFLRRAWEQSNRFLEGRIRAAMQRRGYR